MKKYIAVHTYVAKANHPHLKEGDMSTWYTGKGGTFSDKLEDFISEVGSREGWTKRYHAEKENAKDAEWYRKTEGDCFEHIFGILEIDV